MHTIRSLQTVALVLLFTAGAHADQSTGGTDDKGGSVTGVVKFEGAKKERKVLEMTTDPYCVKAHDDEVLSERWVFGKDDGLANVLVQVTKGPGVDGKKFKAPDKPLVVDQVGCMYVPHVSAVVVGQKVKFQNSDQTLHNVHVIPKVNPPTNMGQPAKGMVTEIALPKVEESIFVKCDVHAWMSCYVHVLPHPYFAITDKDGNFTIKGLPAGDYELKVVHEMKAFQSKEQVLKVTIKDGEASKFNITVTPKAAPTGGR